MDEVGLVVTVEVTLVEGVIETDKGEIVGVAVGKRQSGKGSCFDKASGAQSNGQPTTNSQPLGKVTGSKTVQQKPLSSKVQRL